MKRCSRRQILHKIDEIKKAPRASKLFSSFLRVLDDGPQEFRKIRFSDYENKFNK